MSYKLKCHECKKQTIFLSENAKSYMDDDGLLVLYWECPTCLSIVEEELSWVKGKRNK